MAIIMLIFTRSRLVAFFLHSKGKRYHKISSPYEFFLYFFFFWFFVCFFIILFIEKGHSLNHPIL